MSRTLYSSRVWWLEVLTIVRRTDQAFKDYVHTIFFPNASSSDIDTIAQFYPDDPTKGSPFDTGFEGAFTPQFKRISAFIGDLIFLGPRRIFSGLLSERQKVWSLSTSTSFVHKHHSKAVIVWKRNKTATPLGSVSIAVYFFYENGATEDKILQLHGSDLTVAYTPGDITDNVVNFVNHLDPNGRHLDKTEIFWPRYSKSSPKLLTFVDGPKPQIITDDTFRSESIAFLANLTLQFPLGGP